jgi:predicted alpha-1,2-mannosidase
MQKLSILMLFLSIVIMASSRINSQDLIKYVDPFIGSALHGHTFPGATVPFGMIQLSPDNGTSGWDWCSGYNYSDSIIIGFSHTHLSGTGIGDLCDIRFMPAVLSINSNTDSTELNNLHSSFSHKNEYATPGYYSVFLKNYKIKAELTATERAGFQKYTFPKTNNAIVVLDLVRGINGDKTTEAYIKIINKNTIVGYRMSTGWAKDQRVYFAAKFSQSFTSYYLSLNNKLNDNEREAKGEMLKGIFKFNTEKHNVILVKTGLSSANIKGAEDDLNQEIPEWDFDKIKEDAAISWQNELNKIKITSSSDSLKKTFYTALYHAMMAPNLFSDVDGNFKGADGKMDHAKGYNQMTVFSLWDTFRAEHPLFTIIERNRVNDFVRSMLAHYEETGLLPVWELEGNETNTMIGYHAVPIIADAILKGFRGFNIQEAYEAMKESAMQDTFGIKYFNELGYVPADKISESVSRTLAYCYDDWCIAQIAKFFHKENDYTYFIKRAGDYKNLFDKSTGFMRGKFADGSWRVPFSPVFTGKKNPDYTEGDAWQWTWFVPQDVAGLIKLMGGQYNFVQKLDSLFDQSSVVNSETAPPDVSGLIGQYSQGDEPSHHIAYLYDYAGEPWKTQADVRKICETLYTDSTDGLCGNDDCGQMSAWYIFSAIGFYPVNPASGIYVIGSPMLNKVSIDVGHNKHFTVIANNVSKENKYIQSAELNGKPLDLTYITQKEIMNGGTLVFDMGDKPNKEWGAEKSDAPPSMSEK